MPETNQGYPRQDLDRPAQELRPAQEVQPRPKTRRTAAAAANTREVSREQDNDDINVVYCSGRRRDLRPNWAQGVQQEDDETIGRFAVRVRDRYLDDEGDDPALYIGEENCISEDDTEVLRCFQQGLRRPGAVNPHVPFVTTEGRRAAVGSRPYTLLEATAAATEQATISRLIRTSYCGHCNQALWIVRRPTPTMNPIHIAGGPPGRPGGPRE